MLDEVERSRRAAIGIVVRGIGAGIGCMVYRYEGGGRSRRMTRLEVIAGVA